MLGKITKSLTGIFYLGGKKIRTPGNYRRVDPDTGLTTSKPLRQTNEYIHASVRSRFLLNGPGIEDQGDYEATALRGYKVKLTRDESAAVRPILMWIPRGRQKKSARLPESPLWEIEKELLRSDPDMYDYVLEGPKPSKPDNS